VGVSDIATELLFNTVHCAVRPPRGMPGGSKGYSIRCLISWSATMLKITVSA